MIKQWRSSMDHGRIGVAGRKGRESLMLGRPLQESFGFGIKSASSPLVNTTVELMLCHTGMWNATCKSWQLKVFMADADSCLSTLVLAVTCVQRHSVGVLQLRAVLSSLTRHNQLSRVLTRWHTPHAAPPVQAIDPSHVIILHELNSSHILQDTAFDSRGSFNRVIPPTSRHHLRLP